MSVYEGFTHLSGGKFCHGGLEETASQLLWCEHCGVALCFDCDSHCHHAKNARSTHLRVLLPSSRTSSVPRCEHGSNPTVGEDYHHLVPQAWRRASVRGGLGASSLDDLVSGQSISSSKDKRKRNRKKEKSSSSPLSQKESFKGYESLAKNESKSVPPCEFVTDQKKVACDDGGVVAGEDVDSFVLESDTSDIPLSSSPELGSPILLRTVSLSAAAKPERSALRGGSEQVGLGPRPKLHVKWHPDVFDPICSTVSHTVGHNKTGPAFISRRSYQKHLRQKSKGSSKSQGRGKKQDSSHKSKKKSEPSKSRSHDSYDSLAKNGLQEDSSEFSNSSTDDHLVDLGTDCTKMSEGLKTYDEHVQSDHLREAIDFSEEETEAILYGLHQAKSGDVQLERPANTSVQEKPPVSTRAELALGDKERKTTASNNVEDNLEDFMDVGFPESCLKALACMLHVAKTASKNDALSKTAEYENAAGIFRDTERHARAVNISGPEEVVKQAVQGQSTWISVV